jgi:hypothetical protein
MLALSVACGEPSADRFPALPHGDGEVAALVQRETRRPLPAEEPHLDADRLLAAIARGADLHAGSAAVTRWIEGALDGAEEAYLLFGTYHDAPGQLDAFRRLVGPAGVRGLGVIAVEIFRAGGAWKGAPAEAQRGDDALLDRFLASGDRAAFAQLLAEHRDADYAAWKLGYEESALDLVAAARAASVRLAGCDMPAALQDLAGAQGDLRNRLREIHCLRSLPAGRPRRAALLWGDAHLRPSGIPRFLPPAARVVVVHAFGRRLGGGEVEPALAARLAVNEPLLVPLAPGEAALILPDAVLGGTIDRVLARDATPGSSLLARADVPGDLILGGRALPLGPEPHAIPLPPGEHTYVYRGGGLTIAGSLRLRAGHRIELSFDPGARFTGYTERSPP